MPHYIDKDALIAEIKRRKDESWLGHYTKEKGIVFDITDDILSWIDTLEVKEVDLEKELVDYHNDNFSPCNDGTLLSNDTGSELSWCDYERVTKHFFELGMSVSNKAQKGE